MNKLNELYNNDPEFREFIYDVLCDESLSEEYHYLFMYNYAMMERKSIIKKATKDTIEEIDKMIKFFETIEEYEKANDLLKIKKELKV